MPQTPIDPVEALPTAVWSKDGASDSDRPCQGATNNASSNPLLAAAELAKRLLAANASTWTSAADEIVASIKLEAEITLTAMQKHLEALQSSQLRQTSSLARFILNKPMVTIMDTVKQLFEEVDQLRDTLDTHQSLGVTHWLSFGDLHLKILTVVMDATKHYLTLVGDQERKNKLLHLGVEVEKLVESAEAEYAHLGVEVEKARSALRRSQSAKLQTITGVVRSEKFIRNVLASQRHTCRAHNAARIGSELCLEQLETLMDTTEAATEKFKQEERMKTAEEKLGSLKEQLKHLQTEIRYPLRSYTISRGGRCSALCA